MAAEPKYKFPLRLNESNRSKLQEMSDVLNVSMNSLLNMFIVRSYQDFLLVADDRESMLEEKRKLEEQLEKLDNQIISIW